MGTDAVKTYDANKLADHFAYLVRTGEGHGDENTRQFIDLRTAFYSQHGNDWGRFEKFRDWINAGCRTEVERVAMQLEVLPVACREDHDIAEYPALYYVLDGGRWLPCYNAEINAETGWITAGIRCTDGSTESGPARPGRWANADAQGNPSMPWVWDGEGLPRSWAPEPVTSAAATKPADAVTLL